MKRISFVTQILFLAVFCGLVGFDVLRLLTSTSEPREVKDPQNYSLIHKPKAGCPAGFKELPKVFHRPDASGKMQEYPGCKNLKPRDGIRIDYLLPQESVEFPLMLEADPVAAPAI